MARIPFPHPFRSAGRAASAPVPDGPALPPVERTSRRALLSTAVAGVSGLLVGVLGRPGPASAAAGDPMVLGAANDSGSSQTILANSGLGAAFTLRTTNSSTGATGIFGWSSQTGANATRGVYGKVDGPNSLAVIGRQTGPAGTGAAVFAEGNENFGVHATSTGLAHAIRGVAVDGHGSVGISSTGAGVRGVSVDGTGVSGASENWVAVGGSSVNGFGVWGESTNNYAGFFANHVYVGSWTDLAVIPEPANAGADQARLFVRDADGSLQLCVLFPTGTVQVIASEPPA